MRDLRAKNIRMHPPQAGAKRLLFPYLCRAIFRLDHLT